MANLTTLQNQISELIQSGNYDEAANIAVNQLRFTIESTFSHNGKHFDDDKETRDIYMVTIKRGPRKHSFKFGQSLNDSGFYYTKGKQKIELDRKYLEKDYFKGKSIGLAFTIKMSDYSFLNNGKSDIIHYPKQPTNYDIIACLQKYEIGDFDDFCSEFGYDNDSIKAKKTYKAVLKECKAMQSLFTDEELQVLSEIC